MNEINNDIQKSRLRCFGHMMRMTEEMIPKKMLHTKIEEKRLRGRPRIIWIGQIRGLQKLEGKSRKKYKKTGSGRIETAGDFSVSYKNT